MPSCASIPRKPTVIVPDSDDLDDTWPEDQIWNPEDAIADEPIIERGSGNAAHIDIPALRPSQFTQYAFWMPRTEGYIDDDGEPAERVVTDRFSFEGRRHMVRPYDTNSHKVLLFCARQVEKSTLLGNLALGYMSLVPAYRALYVSPSATQTKTFSNDRIKEPIETSPVLRQFTTTMLSQNIFEKQFTNRSKITMRYAYLNADRCVVGNTRVHFVDGSVATVGEVYNRPQEYLGRAVWAACPSKKGVEPAVLSDVVFQGVRKVFDVRIAGGVELRCTGNQPLLTWGGWRQLDELKPGDFVAVPRRTAHGVGVDRPVEEFRLVGYLLGDGSTKTMNSCALHNGSKEVLRDFRRCAEKLGVILWREQDSNRGHWVHSKTKRQGFGGGHGGYKKRLKALGIIGADHKTKRIPHDLFMGSEEQVAALLGGLYATDGWASVGKHGQYEIGYCSNSKQLLVDMRQLLLRFGIHAFISKQKKPSTTAAQGAYTLSIRHRDSVRQFAANIAVPGKREALSTVLAAARRVTRRKNDYDRIPFNYGEARTYLKQRYGLSTHSAWKQHRIQLRPAHVKDSVGRQVLYSWGAKLGDAWLMWLATSPLGWARLESIEPAGEERTYDLTVPGHENYLSDGVYVHNTRGIPAYLLEIDEFQDVLQDNVPIIEQCLSHAPKSLKRQVYAGTPKSLDNHLEAYRAERSTQCEWVVPCEGCNHWNVLGEKNIGKKGLVCEKCHKLIDPMHPRAQWARMVEEAAWESYRIPQLMVPWVDWVNDILYNYEHYPRDKFYNEVLGISYDSGLRPLTTAQLLGICKSHIKMAVTKEEMERYRQLSYAQHVYAGLDWGTGEHSYTVLFLGMYVDMKFRIFFAHRFTGEEVDPEVQIKKIIKILRYFNVRYIGSDYGGGFDRNYKLIKTFGMERIRRYQYLARSTGGKVVWDQKLGRYKVARTEVMSDIFNAIKRGKCEFPCRAHFWDPHAKDMLNIFSEYSETLRMIQYKHGPDKPDDSFHALLYCWLVSMLDYPRPDIIAPDTEDKEGFAKHRPAGTIDQG